MASAARNRDVEQIDAFMAEPKRLLPKPPEWTASSYPREAQAIWRIEDAAGVESAQLRFRCHTSRRGFPSVSLIFRKLLVERVDLVPQDECKFNPHWAARFGVPATVCGSHGHHWPDNREHLLTDAPWGLPCRRPLPASVRRLPQVLPWLADKAALNLPDDWREFDVPPQTDLFPE